MLHPAHPSLRLAAPALALCLCACASLTRPGAGAPPHPLDPLSAAEIERAAALLRAGCGDGDWRFALLELREPDKAALLAGQPGPRMAFAVMHDAGRRRTLEATVDLETGRVTGRREIGTGQPLMMDQDFEALPDLVLADPRVQAALARRGITEAGDAQVDIWAPGHRKVEGAAPGVRAARCLFFLRGQAGTGYGRPIEGLQATVDLDRREILAVLDSGPLPLATKAHDPFDASEVAPPRNDTPLEIRQPRGPGFILRGQEVAWDRWRFRFSNTAREGLVLRQVGLMDGGRLRPLLFRGSLSEVVVPYGDPGDHWSWRSAFDEGEYGLGQLSGTLERGLTVPENAVLLDTVLADDLGQPQVIPASVALYERDAGLLWAKKDDYDTQKTVACRGRELVLAQLVTVGNYDYLVQWIFAQDGSLRAEVGLTGMLLAKGAPAATCPRCPELAAGAGTDPQGADRHGTLVAPQVVAPNHQHFFCYRLDLDVDGPANSACESNLRAAPDNPGRPGRRSDNAFLMEETVLARESVAGRDPRPMSHRHWRIISPQPAGELGHFPGYVLEPGPAPMPLQADESPVRAHAGFLAHALWVTRQHDAERYAAGDYPNQGPPGQGLPAFTKDDETLAGEDLVVWHAFGVTHVPRPEEWPVMNVARAGFRLAPKGFFGGNPAAMPAK